MAYSLSPLLKPRFFVNATNKPLVGGKLYTYLAETTTPATTYSNDTGTPNTNPIILDANGECNLYLDDDVSYRLILKDANDVTYFDKDRVSSIGGGDYKVLTFNTIDDLRLKIGSEKEPTAQTSGYYAAGDGGGNRFYWDGTSSATDNGGTIIKPTFVSGAGRWLAIDTSYINVKQFGAVGAGVDAPAVSAAIAAAFASGGNTVFFPDGIYYFAAPITVVFDTFRSLRLVGTSSPGFTDVRPGGSRITGASGIAALFIFTKTTVTTWGGYSFECENIDFDGNNRTIGSAIVNKIGGAPMRPFNVYNSNFRAFQKAIYSDISATGLATGICQVNIEGCNFQGNDYALYGKGQSAIVDLRFVGNVCEQNLMGGIYTEATANGSLMGSFAITDNLLEGQPNSIVINGGLANGEIKRNYFEFDTADIINLSFVNPNSSVDIGPNFYYSCSGASVFVNNGKVHIDQNLNQSGIKLDTLNSSPHSVINNQGILYPRSWNRAYIMEIGSTQLNSGVAPSTIDSGAFLSYLDKFELTPAGEVSIDNISGAGVMVTTGATLNAGDALVAVSIVRAVSGTPEVALYVYDNTNNYITNSHSVGLSGVELGRWFLIAAAVKTSVPSGGACRALWLASGGVIDVAKTYTYKIAAPVDNATPVYLYYPYSSPLYGSATYDPPSLVDGAGATTTVTVTGAALGDFAEASFSNDLQGITVTAWVSAPNTVGVRFQNETGGTIDLASGTLQVRVRKV